jgi:hypothetical protein
MLRLSSDSAPGLVVTETYKTLAPNLIERTVTVK